MLTPDDVLSRLLDATPERTALAPKDCRGVYGLVDHHGALRYIGSTVSTSQTFYERIHRRHRTGSEDGSHYFSRMYNTGRMWRMRNDPATRADGGIAKALRNAFIAEYCRAIWVPLPDDADIAGLERAVIELAPSEAIAWNSRATEVYAEPEDLVDRIITRLGYGTSELAALKRQKQRYDAASSGTILSAPREVTRSVVPPFPTGPFRFFALDVETANHDRASICQIGVACVRADRTIETWTTYVDPEVDHWAFTYLHKISAKTVQGAPRFHEVLPMLKEALQGRIVYQHSGFDRSAISAACRAYGIPEPMWDWQDSVQAARRAWPELKGNGGHGLASLKVHLSLAFEHHDAGEDARAAAEVVLHAEARFQTTIVATSRPSDDAFDVIEEIEEATSLPTEAPSAIATQANTAKIIGRTALTAGNIKNNHIYLREFFDAFPKEVVGGSNAATAARQTITVEWGGNNVAVTDLDGEKKFFRKRGWVREFFARTRAVAGDAVLVEKVGPYSYRVTVQRA